MSDNLFMIGRIGVTTVAMPADQVEAVVRMGTVVPAPGAPPCVRGMVAIRSRILTLIDSRMVVGEPADSEAPFMAIISVDGHGYALSFDSVDDVALLPDVQPAQGSITPGWAELNPQLVDHWGQVMLVIDPARIVAVAATASRQAA